MIEQAAGRHDPEVGEYLRQLEDAVGVIDLENDGVALDSQQIGRQLGSLAVTAGDDALRRFI